MVTHQELHGCRWGWPWPLAVAGARQAAQVPGGTVLSPVMPSQPRLNLPPFQPSLSHDARAPLQRPAASCSFCGSHKVSATCAARAGPPAFYSGDQVVSPPRPASAHVVREGSRRYLHRDWTVRPVRVDQVAGGKGGHAELLHEGCVGTQRPPHLDALVGNQVQDHLGDEMTRHLLGGWQGPQETPRG